MATKKAKVVKTNPMQQPMSSQQTPGSNRLPITTQGQREASRAMKSVKAPQGRVAELREQNKRERKGSKNKNEKGYK